MLHKKKTQFILITNSMMFAGSSSFRQNALAFSKAWAVFPASDLPLSFPAKPTMSLCFGKMVLCPALDVSCSGSVGRWLRSKKGSF